MTGPHPMTGDPARRRRIVAGTALLGTALLARSLSTRPGSAQFYATSLATAATWTAGALAAGALRAPRRKSRGTAAPVLRGSAAAVLIGAAATAAPVLIGVGAFGVFYGAALIARRLPALNRAITEVFQYDRAGSGPLVLLTALAGGAGEEAFFRGALYDALGPGAAVVGSTAIYALVTTATRNPALVLASTVMGTLFALQRRTTGGIRAPLITHLTWSTLMLHHLPPLFRPPLRHRILPDG